MEWARCCRRRPSRGRPAATGGPVCSCQTGFASCLPGARVSSGVAGEVYRDFASVDGAFAQKDQPVHTACVAHRPPLSAVSCTLVGDVAYVVEVETLGAAALIV